MDGLVVVALAVAACWICCHVFGFVALLAEILHGLQAWEYFFWFDVDEFLVVWQAPSEMWDYGTLKVWTPSELNYLWPPSELNYLLAPSELAVPLVLLLLIH